ncbi:hypothetical protein BGZ73_007162 [Actinomortierella ambigua]|nr:hypothetical protein BGZ73_007162 [Actinomortierella ambigua]
MTTNHQGMQVLLNDDPDASTHVAFMKLAIEQAEKSIPVPSGYCVGAVLVKKTKITRSSNSSTPDRYQVVATGFSRELPGNTHAEECCLLKLAQIQAAQTQDKQDKQDNTDDEELIMYSTMEPCSHRLSGNRPCSDRLIASRVRTVYVGDMVQHGLTVVHIPGFEKACLAPNRHVLGEA